MKLRIEYNKVNFRKWGEDVEPDDGKLTDILVLARDGIMKLNPDITVIEFVDSFLYKDDKIVWTVEKKGRTVIVWNEKELKSFPA